MAILDSLYTIKLFRKEGQFMEKNLGTIIKNARHKVGLSQMDLATLTGLSHLEITRIETNNRKKLA